MDNGHSVMTTVIRQAEAWFHGRGWKVSPFQRAAWKAYLAGKHGMVSAPTGSGKTYALFVALLLEYMLDCPGKKAKGLQALWITPIRALSKEIEVSAQRAVDGLGLDWRIGVRTGDTSAKDRAKLKRNPPQLLIITPESLHLMLASKGYPDYFGDLKAIVVDEWHELMGSKRGVQCELAFSRLKSLSTKLRIWGISATIGNMEQSLEALLGKHYHSGDYELICSHAPKNIEVLSVLPDVIETLPWAGHLGIRLLDKVIPLIKKSRSTLIFANTRAFAETWYQKILEVAPELSGEIAMHHGSISRELRDWVENALHTGQLKAVVCTSSLDLGVDFRPVETIIQIGSPKGVARFMQRAGRSGHQPGGTSRIYFVPTHSLELMEAAALREAITRGLIEDRVPYLRSFDVLVQYLVTLAVSEGFCSEGIYEEVRSTFSFSSISLTEWQWVLGFICSGGQALTAYDEYRKVIKEEGVYKVDSRRIALRHRLSIGTIVSDPSLQVKYVSGKYIGTVEEWFVASLKPGDVFWFAGRNLELVRIKDMIVQVRKSGRKSGRVPSWQGGRMPLSSRMSDMLRLKCHQVAEQALDRDVELQALEPLMDLQRNRSHLPRNDEFLVESFFSKEGHHVMMFPFEGRFVHEGMAAVLAHRIAQLQPLSFSIAMNDYGFELLSDAQIPIEEALGADVLSPENLLQDIQASVNATEMARRKFRDIAAIAGLVFKGYPGHQLKERHLQSSSQLFFEVFHEHEPDNLLLKQAFEEVLDFQMEEVRLRQAMNRIQQQKIILTHPQKPTPFAFPIMVDRLRERLSSEKLEDRVRKMKLEFGD